MEDDRSRKFADLAPLTKSFALHLASYLLRMAQRPAGRPHKTEGADVVTRAERRLLEAIDQLIPLVQARNQSIYDLVNPVVTSGNLTEKWLLQTLNQFTPGKRQVYPQRLAEWRRANLLLYCTEDEPEPNSVCCLLLARAINPNRTGWLPRPPAAETYWCWRLNTPDSSPFPYELPLAVVTGTTERPVYRPRPEPGVTPYILYTPWKGASWDDSAWLVYDEGAVRWVGDPTEDVLTLWLLLQEQERLSLQGEPEESRARRALRILASRLIHNPSSGNTT